MEQHFDWNEEERWGLCSYSLSYEVYTSLAVEIIVLAFKYVICACSTQQQQIRSLDMEVDNYKKSIIKEEERNEELTMLLNKINADISHITKQIEASASKRDHLKTEYVAYTRALQETEQSLAKAATVRWYSNNTLESRRFWFFTQ